MLKQRRDRERSCALIEDANLEYERDAWTVHATALRAESKLTHQEYDRELKSAMEQEGQVRELALHVAPNCPA